MSHPLKHVIESLVISDRYLDREEEALFWEAVERLAYDRTEAELLLTETLTSHEATRESSIYEELKRYLQGPLRDKLLDFEEEKRCVQWLLQHPQIPTGAHERLLLEACAELGAHVASQLIGELIKVFKERYQMPHWSEAQRQEAVQWATTRWSGLSAEQVYEVMDSFLD